MKAPFQTWFVQSASQERRRPQNRLRRATREAEDLEDRMVDRWLELGRVALDGHEAASAKNKLKFKRAA
jgi:hypothetical protein